MKRKYRKRKKEERSKESDLSIKYRFPIFTHKLITSLQKCFPSFGLDKIRTIGHNINHLYEDKEVKH